MTVEKVIRKYHVLSCADAISGMCGRARVRELGEKRLVLEGALFVYGLLSFLLSSSLVTMLSSAIL